MTDQFNSACPTMLQAPGGMPQPYKILFQSLEPLRFCYVNVYAQQSDQVCRVCREFENGTLPVLPLPLWETKKYKLWRYFVIAGACRSCPATAYPPQGKNVGPAAMLKPEA